MGKEYSNGDVDVNEDQNLFGDGPYRKHKYKSRGNVCR